MFVQWTEREGGELDLARYRLRNWAAEAFRGGWLAANEGDLLQEVQPLFFFLRSRRG